MSMLIPVFTTAGIEAIFNADNNGVEAEITELALGEGAWTPGNEATSLKIERNRIPVSGKRIGTQIHLTGVEDSVLNYWVREIGVYLSDGTLLAVWSSPTDKLLYKSAIAPLLLSYDFSIAALPADSITISGEGGFTLPVATSDKRGLLRIATNAESNAGILNNVAVTPAQLNAMARDDAYVETLVRKELIGRPFYHTGEVPPPNCAKLAGHLYSREIYHEWWGKISNPINGYKLVSDGEWINNKLYGCYSTGDGSTTFRAPDPRAMVIKGWDNGRGLDPGRVFGSYQEDDIKAHRINFVDDKGWEYHLLNDQNLGAARGTNAKYYHGPDEHSTDSAMNHIDVPGAPENRVKNISWMICTYYK